MLDLGPYPIAGEQASAKTVLSNLFKALIDPNAVPVRTLARTCPPPSPTHFARSRAAAASRYGDSIPTMTRHYTDNDEALFQAARPVFQNGVDKGALNGPPLARLRDRAAAHSGCPARRGGALLTRAAPCSLRETAADNDFVLSAIACETAFWPIGTFLRAYEAKAQGRGREVVPSVRTQVSIRRADRRSRRASS